MGKNDYFKVKWQTFCIFTCMRLFGGSSHKRQGYQISCFATNRLWGLDCPPPPNNLAAGMNDLNFVAKGHFEKFMSEGPWEMDNIRLRISNAMFFCFALP